MSLIDMLLVMHTPTSAITTTLLACTGMAGGYTLHVSSQQIVLANIKYIHTSDANR